MKTIVLCVLLCILSVDVVGRRLHHYGIRKFLHHLDLDVGEVEKRIFRDVLTDKDVSAAIVDGKAGTEDFKKSVLRKTLGVIGSNDEYLKPLSQKIFASSSLGINDDEKLKVLRTGLKDENLQNLIVEDKGKEAILKRIGELIENDNELLQSLAKQTFKDNEVGKQLNDQQKVALLKIFLHNPELIKKGTVAEDAVNAATKQVENNNDLKDFFNQHKNDFIEKLLKNR